jgi:hypothetical protein
MQKTLNYIWRGFVVLLFLSGLCLIALWLLRVYEVPFLVKHIPDDAFEPLITMFTYLTGFSGVSAIATWFAQKRSATQASSADTAKNSRNQQTSRVTSQTNIGQQVSFNYGTMTQGLLWELLALARPSFSNKRLSTCWIVDGQHC